MRSNWFEAFFPRRGLEVPCVLEFTGNIKDTAKAKQLINSSMLGRACSLNTISCKAPELQTEVVESATKKQKTSSLSSDDHEQIIMRERLSDLHISYAHELLK